LAGWRWPPACGVAHGGSAGGASAVPAPETWDVRGEKSALAAGKLTTAGQGGRRRAGV